mgnify:CR=1 FL=1
MTMFLYKEAKLLAKKHQKVGLHFSKSLEWLLFTALEFEATSNSSRKRTSRGTSVRRDAQVPHLSHSVVECTELSSFVGIVPCEGVPTVPRRRRQCRQENRRSDVATAV